LTLGLFRERPVVFPWGKLAKLQTEQQQLQAEIKSEEARLLDPGPEPSYWHPMDHYLWTQKAAAYNQIQARILDRQEALSKVQIQINNLIKSFWPRTFGVIRAFFGWLWSACIVRLLHLFLILALISFASRIFFRWLLMTGKFGATRV